MTKAALVASSARPIADILAEAADKVLKGPQYDPKDVLDATLAELGTDATRQHLARLLALHDLFPEGEPARKFLANLITMTHSSITLMRDRAAQLAAAV